jgi:hypothetical protein
MYRGINFPRRLTDAELEQYKNKFMSRKLEVVQVFSDDESTVIVVKGSGRWS